MIELSPCSFGKSSMTSIVDSTAHFAQRASEVGLSHGGLGNLVRNGFDSLGKLAFSQGQPGMQIEAGAFHMHAQGLLGAMMTLGDEAALKRLLFEGRTMVLSQLREAVSNPEASHSRRLRQVERTAKLADLKARLVGVCIERQLDPSHSLLDATSQMYEAQQLTYLPPDKCTSREWEISRSKTSKQLSIDSDKLTIKEKQDLPDQTATGEMQVFEALRRRGIALDFANLLTWQVHERYLARLFGHLRKDPVEGYCKVSLQQMLRADRDAWTRIIEAGCAIRRDAAGALPLDTELIRSLESYEVAFNLVPLPKPSSANPSKNEWRENKDYRPWQQYDRRQHQYWNKPYHNPGGKGRGKGHKGRTQMLPKAFRGRDCTAVDPHNRRLCFGYNLGSCSQVSDGASCKHGYHLCMRVGCHAPHREKDHDGDRPADPRTNPK